MSPANQPLLIGELAAQTGATPRMLRHYEKHGLITAQRSSAGQRLFPKKAIAQVRHIRMLLAAGLPIRVISELLTCIREHDRLDPCAVPQLLEHLQTYDAQLAQLTATRDVLQGLITAATEEP